MILSVKYSKKIENYNIRLDCPLAHEVLFGFINTPEEVAAREKKLTSRMKWASRSKANGEILPNYPFEVPRISEDNMDSIYRGRQTASALIAEFDKNWTKRYPQSVDWDAHYPKAAWLRKVIDKGGKIESIGDYSYYLKLRRNLIKLKETPDKWGNGYFGIPPTSNFEEYQSAYIDRKIWENDIRKEVRATYPNAPQITTFFPNNQPDKYLPVVGDMTYVYRKPNSSAMVTYGTLLTQEQSVNLKNKGIEPEGIEIVYIDGDFNILSEKPKPYNHQEWLEKNSYDIVPEGLRAPDGTIVDPERYQEIKGVPMPYEIRQRYDEYVGTESPFDSDAARREAARETAAADQEAAKTEFEKFQNSMRQLEEFATMSDVEIEKALERQFRRQFLPEHPVEQLTPERLEEALGTLFKHGFEEGFRRVKRDNPELANQLEQYFGRGQENPPKILQKRKKPVPPTPPEVTHPESNASN